ncbi:MAG: hypothetical protein JWR80_8074 [Bradyrhizobium sp.]|nr:hypothetical protein [Bradyrhizobium sp.]
MTGNLGTSPFEINGPTFSYQLRDAIGPVPEPGTWAMMLVDFCVTGAAMRRGRRPIQPLNASIIMLSAG